MKTCGLIMSFVFVMSGVSQYASESQRIILESSEGVYEVREEGTGKLLSIIDSKTPPAKITPTVAPPYQTGWPWISGGGNFSMHSFVADVNYDGDLEVIFTVYEAPEFRLYVKNHDGSNLAMWSIPDNVDWSPSLADMNGDGTLEILVRETTATSQDTLKCYLFNGTLLWERQASCCGRRFRTISVSDMDGDGTLEVFAIAGGSGTTDQAFLLSGVSGAILPGWPIILAGYGRSYYQIGDTDGDDDSEIFIPEYGSSFLVYAFHHDGSNVAGYPSSTGAWLEGVMGDGDDNGTWDLMGNQVGVGIGIYDLNRNPLAGWPQAACSSNRPPSFCDIDGDGNLEISISSLNVCAPGTTGYSYLFRSDGTDVPGWPVANGNFGAGQEMLIGDTDGDGELNFVFGATEGSFTPTGRIFNYREDGTSDPDYPLVFSDNFGGSSGTLSDLDLDGDVEHLLPTEQLFGGIDSLYVWDFPAPYDPSTMYWRMGGGNMQHTGEYHSPDYYIPRVDTIDFTSISPSCLPSTIEIDGAHFESKPFIWFVPSADTSAFYSGNLALGIPATSVTQNSGPGTGVNPLQATHLSVGVPVLPEGDYELVVQNPTGIRNVWQTATSPPVPIISITQSQIELADLDSDGRVDGQDLAFLASAFGCPDTNPCFKPVADINQDLWIDGLDLALLAPVFGQYWSCP